MAQPAASRVRLPRGLSAYLRPNYSAYGRAHGGVAQTAAVACLLTLAILSPPLAVADVTPPLVPEREVVQQEERSPAWKVRWDQARELIRQGRMEAAATVYEELLVAGPRLYEARWELVRLRLHLGEPEQALAHLELLREGRPENREYSRSLAQTLLAVGRFGRSAELFARLLAQEPTEPELLAGLAAAFLGQGQDEQALPPLEKLIEFDFDYPGLVGEPTASSAAESLARLYRRLGMVERARPLVLRLAQSSAATPDLLLLAAEIHEDLGLRRQAADYWRRIPVGHGEHPGAVARLESYLLSEGQGEEALQLLLSRLAANPDDPRLLQRSARVYLGMSRFRQAAPYLERYLEIKPADRESLLLLLDIYNTLGQRAEALVTLERLLVLEGGAAPDKLLQAALLYEERGDDLKALALYPRIMEQRPGEPELIARRLRLLDRLGREGEIRELLEQPEQRRRTPEILAAWYALAPTNRKVAAALALVYLEEGLIEESAKVLLALEEEGTGEPEFLRVRALLRERQRRPHAAWRDYEELLGLEPQAADLRRRALKLAAELGLLDRVGEHRRYAGFGASFGPQQTLEEAGSLLDAGDLGAAAELLRGSPAAEESAELQVERLLEQARLLRLAGLIPEAEQALRLALLAGMRSVEVYAALFALTLEDGRPSEAELWLTALERRLNFYPQIPVTVAGRRLSPAEARLLAELLQVRLWLASGEEQRALRLLARLAGEGGPGVDGVQAAAVAALVAADSLWQAERLLQEELLNADSPLPEALVLAALVSQRRGRPEAGELFLGRARQWAAVDPGRGLELAELLIRHALPGEVAAVLAPVATELPNSLRVGLLLAEARAASGQPGEALDELARLQERYPEQFIVQWRRLPLLLQLGRLDEVVAESARLAAAHPWSRAELVLLRVQALWLQRQWRPALKELDEQLAPPVNALFAAAAEEGQLSVPSDEPPGPWRRITGAVNPLTAFIDSAMAPAHAAGLQVGDERVRRLAAPLYAQYRRQQRFALELQARNAVERREFFAATRAFERLVQKYPDQQPLLYDLAGLYSRMDRLEPEAAIYRELEAEQVHYPGLAEARQRNELKRRPRSTLEYQYLREEGRDGHKAMVGRSWGASHWLAPYLGHEFEFAVARLHYRDPNGGGSSAGRRAELLYRRDAFAGVDLLIGLGARTLDKEGNEELLGRAEIAGDFGDRFWGRLAYRRELVEDTLAAVRGGVLADSLALEGALDLLPRLEAGAGYDYRYYSDYNQLHGYKLWAAYTIFTDPTLLTFRYTYDFQDTRSSSTGSGAPSPPYWAPSNYWRKTLELNFRHQLSDDPFLRDIPRYYTLRYATIYDSDGYAHQLLAGAFFLEWSDRLILQAGVELYSAPEERRRALKAAITYRW